MDFPINLSTTFVVGLDEFKQTLVVLFQNGIGTFLQSRDVGSKVPEHSGSEDLIELGVMETAEQIPGVTVESISVQLPTVRCTVKYKDEIINFTFSVNEK